MADAKAPAPAPAPPPPKPKVSVAERARADIAQGRTGMRLDRPLHYATAFVKGTVSGLLGGMAKWGRFGLKWGLILGVTVAIGFPALQLIASGPIMASLAGVLTPLIAGMGEVGVILGSIITGTLGGAALGGTYGGLTGGKREMGREMRRDKYAEDLVERKQVRKAVPAATSEDRATKRKRDAARDAFATNYAVEFEKREGQGEATYWQDHAASGGFGRSR